MRTVRHQKTESFPPPDSDKKGSPLWHTKTIQTVFHSFDTTPQGLSHQAAQIRLKNTGLNQLPHKKPTAQWLRFFDQLTSPIILMLSAAAIVKLLLHKIGDALAILFVVLFNALLGFIQERKAETSLKALRQLSAPKAKVRRDGKLEEVRSEEIVVGDLIVLESGVRITADARLIESHALDVDESMLTGESLPVRKNALASLEEDTPLFARSTVVYAQTTVVRGRGLAVVTATGPHTEVADILAKTESTTTPTSPLERRMTSFAHAITLATLTMVGFIVLLGPFHGYTLSSLMMICVSLTVSAVPEGLPIAITIVLSHGLVVMARRKAIVRNLGSVETLGCTTVICTDKTGTLTENTMVVGKAVIGLEEGATWAMRIARYCTEARCDGEKVIGDPVDTALMHYARANGFSENDWNNELFIPFESDQQIMACTITKESLRYTVWKGSFESLGKRCRYMWHGSSLVPFDADLAESFVRDMSGNGLKVLCLAYGQGNDQELTMAGIVGLVDPPRTEAKTAVETCQRAGIRVIMVTGDDPRTAKAIAQECGLKISEQPDPYTGRDLDTMDDAALSSALKTASIFARITPSHKLRIVQLLQKSGAIVAMTGDGVNDAPPLKQADIGIAMGDGPDVAKEASSMVILNNSLLTIVDAIRQGRVIFRSLQQTVVYLTTTCLSGVMTVATAILLELPLPILPLQFLWINLVTDGTTTIPLSLEGEHGDIMKAPPRNKDAPFISGYMFRRSLLAAAIMMVGTLGVFIWVWQWRHGSLEYARTMTFTTLALFQILNALNSRSVRRSLFFTFHSKINGTMHTIPFSQNRWLLIVLTACLSLQIFAVELPFLQNSLQTTPLSWSDWMWVFGISSSVILGVEIHKAWKFFFQRFP